MFKGVVLSVLASVLFGVMYFYTSLMKPLDGEEIFGWRMLLTVPCATLFMLVSGDWRRVRDLAARLWQQPLLIFGLLLSSMLL
ncbi:EamA family transporter RarD, partial [Pseudomonas syringae pv. actinidiae]|nr:EamA family transporter RarD [Pseudomonas syringae pv. actinidiae]